MKASSAQRHIRLSNPPGGFKTSSELLQRAARASPAPPLHLLRTLPDPLQQRGVHHRAPQNHRAALDHLHPLPGLRPRATNHQKSMKERKKGRKSKEDGSGDPTNERSF